MKYYGWLLLTVYLLVFGCAAPEINEVMLATQLQDTQQAIRNAAELEAEALVPAEYARAVKLLNFAQDSQDTGDFPQSAEFAYQAELVAQIAGLQARQHRARQNVVDIREEIYRHIIQAKENEIEITRIREALLEERLARALNAQSQGTQQAEQLSSEISELRATLRQAELRLSLTKVEMLFNTAKHVYPAITETAAYERVQAAIASIDNLIQQRVFPEVEIALATAEENADALSQLAKKNMEAETAAQLDAHTAIAKAEAIIQRAQYLNAVQHAPQQFQTAADQLKRAKEAVAGHRYDQAQEFAQQAQRSADKTVMIAEAQEFRHRAEKELERLETETRQVLEALKANLEAQAETTVPQLEAQLYKLASSAYETASAAAARQEYDTALAAAAEGKDYLARAIANAYQTTSAKSDLAKAASGIPKAIVIEQKDNVLIRIRGNAFAHGSTQLQKEFSATFAALANVLRNTDFSSYPVRVEVHTSALGTAAVNRSVSMGRADSIKRVLVAEGRIDAARITAVGLGETQPLITEGANKEEQNRRIDVIIQTN